MNNKKMVWLTVLIATITTTVFISSCKKKFDEPPTYLPPNITANTTIRALKLRHTSGQFEKIVGDTIIRGIVVADDKSGNLYKSIVIQDATAGITVRLDGNSLYANYPVGREIFIKCKGLVLGDYNGLVQIGGAIDDSDPTRLELAPLPSVLFDTHLIKGSLDNPVTARVVTPAQLTTQLQDTLQSTLIQLNNFEFATGDTSKTYADPTRASTARNFIIRDCGGNSITLRNSSFANFTGLSVPNNNGSIVAIYTIFGSTKQLNIRDTSDLKFNSSRCAIFEEDFEGTTGTGDVAIAGWKNIAEVGGVTWKYNAFGGTRFMQTTAFNAPGNPAVVTSWAITPGISLVGTTTPQLTFQTIDGFNNGAELRVMISTNYNGSATPSTSTWTTLGSSIANPTMFAGPTASGYASTWKNSGNINLAAYAGQTVYIAFRYDGANPATGTRKTTTWEVDNVKIVKQ